MINLNDIEKAMAMISNPMEYLFCEAIHKQLAKSLEACLDRGEYIENDMASAIVCLSMSGHEIKEQNSDNRIIILR